jgi:hypothetical protein
LSDLPELLIQAVMFAVVISRSEKADRFPNSLAATVAIRVGAALAADSHTDIDGMLHRSRVPRMSGLPARLATALAPTASQALSTGEPVRCRWLRG